MKTCAVCKREKPEELFPWYAGKLRRRTLCKRCHVATNTRYNEKYLLTVGGVASHLRKAHGFDVPTSVMWAAVLLAPNTRCCICGIPKHRLVRQGFWKIGGWATNRRRMSLDHITPGVNDGLYRALCLSCNVLRGDNKLTDAEVLLVMRQWYRESFPGRKLYWLNTHIEDGIAVGGRLHRNEHMKRKFDDLNEGEAE